MARGRVSDGPHTQVVHVRHDGPVVAELDLLAGLQEAVLVGGLLVVATDAQGVAKSQALVLQEWSYLVHLIIY